VRFDDQPVISNYALTLAALRILVRAVPVRDLIYIAMTALGRVLTEIAGAEHKTGRIFVPGAILLAVLLLRFASHKDDPSD
jgi:phosphate starvation-inducible membrane PsiE